jgi:hypothetical protein
MKKEPPSEKTVETQALRVKVAELCGWQCIEWRNNDCPNNADYHGIRGVARIISPQERAARNLYDWSRLPDYPNDLNACAEMEKVIKATGLCVEYVNELRDHSLPDNGTLSRYGLVAATAEQRCRAFVAVMEASRPEAADSVQERSKSDGASGKHIS